MPQTLPKSKSPLRVLYIEDNALVREITYELLAIDDREVVAVESAEEALLAFARGPFDLVVTDVSLPAMSGFDLVRHVKKLAPAVPIILATGYPLDLDEAQLGAHIRALTKPFDSSQLEALIETLCGREGGEDQAARP